MLEKIKFHLKAFFIITFSKEFQAFEKEYLKKSPQQRYSDGQKPLTEKERTYLNIIYTCYTFI